MEKSSQELALERVREMEEILQSQREELAAMQNALRIFADSRRTTSASTGASCQCFRAPKC